MSAELIFNDRIVLPKIMGFPNIKIKAVMIAHHSQFRATFGPGKNSFK